MDCQSLRDKGRKLILPVGDGSLEAVLAKARRRHHLRGARRLRPGRGGKRHHHGERQPLFEILDLGFGRCSFALAVPKGVDFYQGYRVKTIATKYPGVARRFFESRDMDVRVIKIEGSVEPWAPLLGLADGIVDIVETGTTLKENGLEVVERIAGISARLIVNAASLKLRKQEIESLAAKLEAAIAAGKEQGK